jgi:light-regulated signal transduction histidine kinase (bacteriophytochrome)
MDLSPEKRVQAAEAECGQLKAALQHRTAELEALNKELEALAYAISHDLRAPLRHIDAFATLLDREAGEGLSKEAKSYLSIISQAALDMGKLLEQLLAFSRLNRTELLPQPFDINPAMDELIHKALEDHPGRLINWKKSNLPRLYADSGALRQALAHLISNAVKFTRCRHPAEIEIGFSEDASEVIVFVRDNGIGFDMRYADKLFGILQRLHRVEEYEGVGIGLASVRRIVARHGGRTWAESKPNGGATFYFSLPKKME